MDVLPYRNKRLVVRSHQDQQAIKLLDRQTLRVKVGDTERYATLLLRVKNMPSLHASLEATLPQLRSTERRLMKAPEQASAYQGEIHGLEEACYVVKVEPDEVKSEEAWYMPHHIVHCNGKNWVVYSCSLQFKGHNLNGLLLPGSTLGPSLLAVLLRFLKHQLRDVSSGAGGTKGQTAVTVPEGRQPTRRV